MTAIAFDAALGMMVCDTAIRADGVSSGHVLKGYRDPKGRFMAAAAGKLPPTQAFLRWVATTFSNGIDENFTGDPAIIGSFRFVPDDRASGQIFLNVGGRADVPNLLNYNEDGWDVAWGEFHCNGRWDFMMGAMAACRDPIKAVALAALLCDGVDFPLSVYRFTDRNMHEIPRAMWEDPGRDRLIKQLLCPHPVGGQFQNPHDGSGRKRDYTCSACGKRV